MQPDGKWSDHVTRLTMFSTNSDLPSISRSNPDVGKLVTLIFVLKSEFPTMFYSLTLHSAIFFLFATPPFFAPGILAPVRFKVLL